VTDKPIQGGFTIWARKTLDSDLWTSDPAILRLMMWLVWEARWSANPKHFPGFVVRRGEVLTSLRRIADACEYESKGRLVKWSVAKVSRMLNTLAEQGRIERLPDSNGTHLKVTNYALYQDPKAYQADSSDTGLQSICKASAKQLQTTEERKEGCKHVESKPISAAPKARASIGTKEADLLNRLRAYIDDPASEVKADHYGDVLLFGRAWQAKTNAPYTPERSVSVDLRTMKGAVAKMPDGQRPRDAFAAFFAMDGAFIRDRAWSLAEFVRRLPKLLSDAAPTPDHKPRQEWVEPTRMTFAIPRPLRERARNPDSTSSQRWIEGEGAGETWDRAAAIMGRDDYWPDWMRRVRPRDATDTVIEVEAAPDVAADVEADRARIEAALAEVLKAEGSST